MKSERFKIFTKNGKSVTHEPKMLGHISARSYLLGYANAIKFIERSKQNIDSLVQKWYRIKGR